MKKTAMENLASKYFDKIEIEYASIYPNRTWPEGAVLTIVVPRSMIEEYSSIKERETLDFYSEKRKNRHRKLPDAAEFWNKTMLENVFRNSEKPVKYEYANLNEVLDFFRFRMVSRFTEIDGHGSEFIRMIVQDKYGPYGVD